MRRPLALAVTLVLLAPLAAAHEDHVIFELRIDDVGPAVGAIDLELDAPHHFEGIGVSCAFGTAGELRIVTPSGGAIRVSFSPLGGCQGSSDNTELPAGDYHGAYALAASAPLFVIIYATEGE